MRNNGHIDPTPKKNVQSTKPAFGLENVVFMRDSERLTYITVVIILGVPPPHVALKGAWLKSVLFFL